MSACSVAYEILTAKKMRVGTESSENTVRFTVKKCRLELQRDFALIDDNNLRFSDLDLRPAPGDRLGQSSPLASKQLILLYKTSGA
jgi:hypothetical protein